jgi:hypothetical protein
MEQIKKQDVTHYVIVSDTHGIYLGDGRWSKINHGEGKKEALCVPKGIAVRVLIKIIQLVGTASLKEVHPDGPMTASEQACVNAGLPYWNPSLFKPND